MKNPLMNSKQISRWAYNKMRTLNKHIKQWAQSGPLPMGRKATVPKWVYSNSRNKLNKMFNSYKKQPDQYFRKYDKSGITREPLLDLESQIKNKLHYADIRHNMKIHPKVMIYKDDLKFKNGFQTSKQKIKAYSNNFEPNTSLISASTVKKDLKKLNKLDTTDTSMFLADHPKFSMAVNAFSAQTVYDSYKRSGVSTAQLTNMNEIYDGKGLKHGHLDDNIHAGELQVRALKYIHQKEQITQGKQFSHALTQAASIFVGQHAEPNVPNGDWLRQAPDLQAKLHVEPGNFITHNNKDRHSVYDIETKKPMSNKAFNKMNFNYMVRGTQQMAHTLKSNQNPLSSSSVIQQAIQITQKSGKQNSRANKLRHGIQMDDRQLKLKDITASDKAFFAKDKQANLKQLHQSQNKPGVEAKHKLATLRKSSNQKDNQFNQHNNKHKSYIRKHTIQGPIIHRSRQHGFHIE